MAKNKAQIQIDAKGAEETKRKLHGVSGAMKDMGKDVTKSNEAAAGSGKKLMKSLGALKGVLGFGGLAAGAIAAARKVLTAIDDMKAAASKAVKEIADLQRASSDFFEAMGAYTPAERINALRQARSTQQRTGLGFEQSKLLRETYKRTFGDTNEPAVDQMAGYWQLHGGDATPDLVRWMGASGVKDIKRQGQITRMISTVAEQTGLRDSEIIRGLTRYSTEFRGFGWGPEESIKNVGTTMSGLSSMESRRAIGGLVQGLKTFTEEKALEHGAPAEIAANEQSRLAWAKMNMNLLDANKRRKFAQEAFAKEGSVYVTKFMTGASTAEMEERLQFSATEQAAEIERKRAVGFKKTAEGVESSAEGAAGQIDLDISPDQKTEAATRKIGAAYLEKLRRSDRLKYEKITLTSFGDQAEAEAAAFQLYSDTLPAEERSEMPFAYGHEAAVAWQGMKPRRRLESLQAPTINYITENNYYPSTGEDDRGGRFKEAD